MLGVYLRVRVTPTMRFGEASYAEFWRERQNFFPRVTGFRCSCRTPQLEVESVPPPLEPEWDFRTLRLFSGLAHGHMTLYNFWDQVIQGNAAPSWPTLMWGMNLWSHHVRNLATPIPELSCQTEQRERGNERGRERDARGTPVVLGPPIGFFWAWVLDYLSPNYSLIITIWDILSKNHPIKPSLNPWNHRN